jgi:hypothetical protein
MNVGRGHPDSGDAVSVRLPRTLWRRLERHLKGNAGASIEDFVAHAVREALAREEDATATGLSPEDEQRVKARLRALGYLE